MKDSNKDSKTNPAMQGEGDYNAARRHRESVKSFVAEGHVEDAAKAAKPANAKEAEELKQAEKAGREKARS